MAKPELEDHVTAVELEIERLKKLVEAQDAQKSTPWFEKIFGTFRDDPDYEEAMRLGREYREFQRPDYDDNKEQS